MQFPKSIVFDYRRPPWRPVPYNTRRERISRECYKAIPDQLYHRLMLCKLTGTLNARKPRVVHGHFRADQFDRLYGNARHSLWLRDPADLIASWYRFGLKHPHCMDSHFRTIQEMKLTEDTRLMCAATHLPVNVQTSMLGGLKLDDFDFVGIYERWPDSLRLFCRVFKLDMSTEMLATHLNASGGPTNSCRLLSPHVRRELQALNHLDALLYEQALSRYDKLSAEYS